MNHISRLDFENAIAEVICFDNGTEVREYQAIIHVANPRLAYAQQLEAVLNAYDALRTQFADTQAVFKRYFLSDAANQADDIIAADLSLCA